MTKLLKCIRGQYTEDEDMNVREDVKRLRTGSEAGKEPKGRRWQREDGEMPRNRRAQKKAE